MCRKSTVLALLLPFLLGEGLVHAQAARADWRHNGSLSLDLSAGGAALAGPSSGPVERVWYGDNGSTLYALTQSGKVFETGDFEVWRPSRQLLLPRLPPVRPIVCPKPVPPSARSICSTVRQYAFGQFVYRSDDGGKSWDALTAVHAPGAVASLVGAKLSDLAISPKDPDEIAVAGDAGVFRSLDAGRSPGAA